MTRIFRICKADLHGVMDRFEDRELLAKQHLREMEDSLHQKEARIRQIDIVDKQLQKELSVTADEIDKLESDLQIALQKERDNIARLLLRKQYLQHNHCAELQKRRDTHLDEHRALSQLLEEQRLHYELLSVKVESLSRNQDLVCFPEVSNEFAATDNCLLRDDEIERELMRRKESMRTVRGAP